jgi:phosphatidylglycerophosphatase A
MAPIAPGTVASAVTAVILWLTRPSLLVLALAVAIVTVLGIWASDEAEPVLARGKDPGAIVVDEVAGMALSVLTVPLTPAVLVVGFVLFRIFDVLKPFPANVSQRLPGGLGVMIDDLIAGLYALVIVLLIRRMGWL